MGCQKHAFRERDCLACEVKELKAQNKAQSQAQTRAERQAQQVDPYEYYQAETEAFLAQVEAEYAAQAAAEERADQARYRRAMWEQTPDGQAWAEFSRQGQQWLKDVGTHDGALLPEWQHAVEPSWFTEEGKAQRQSAKDMTELPLFLMLPAAVVFFLTLLLGVLTSNHTIWLIKWGSFFAMLVAVVWGFWAQHRYGVQARSLDHLQKRSDEVKAFVERYGANPFTEPEKLPSWREGLTRGQNAAQIQAVKGWVYLDLNKFPAASSLPTLPPIVARSDLADWPEPVAQALRARLTQN